MPYSSVDKGSSYFDTSLYTGTGSSLSVSNLNFQPDWVWLKGRSGATDHALYDAVRGVQKDIGSNLTTAETTQTTGLTAFNSNGFTIGTLAKLNTSSATYTSWNWKANGAGSSNNSGTITSTVSANTTSGFSIVSYTGNGTGGATVGHGIGIAPKIIIVKRRTGATEAWPVDCRAVSGIMYLNETGAKGSYGTIEPFPSTAPTSSVFSIGSANNANANGSPFIAYCFADVKGFSKFGSYTGNGSTNGTFVYTGFKPAFVIRKRTDTTGSWIMQDSYRPAQNRAINYTSVLYSDTSGAETIYNEIDIVSNGFKIVSSDAFGNASGGTYIYMAFAENPFVTSKGIPVCAR